MERMTQTGLRWTYRLLAFILGIELLLAWLQLIETGSWTVVVSNGYRLDQTAATVWLGLRSMALILILIGWRPNLLLKAVAIEIIVGFLIACFDVSVYWRVECGCLPSSPEAYHRIGLRGIELVLMILLRR